MNTRSNCYSLDRYEVVEVPGWRGRQKECGLGTEVSRTDEVRGKSFLSSRGIGGKV